MKKFLLMICTCVLLTTGCTKVELIDGGNAVVTFKDKSGVTAEELYEKMVKLYGINFLVDLIDTKLLDNIYDETEDEIKYINQVVASIKNQAGDKFEEYLSYYNVTTEKELEEYIRLNYRRNEYSKDYAKSIVSDKQIQEYYDTVAIGDIEASHILITSDATDSMSAEEKKTAEDEAYNKASQIIKELNDGADFAETAKKYSKDSSNASNGGALGYFNYDDNFDDNFMSAAIELEVGKYSKTPVKSQFGYHIIYKTNQKEKESLKDLTESIKNTISEELLSSDTSLPAKALKALREENEIKIIDSDLNDKYIELIGE